MWAKYKICWNCNSDTRTSLSASCEKEPRIPRRYCSNAWRLTLVWNKVVILLMAWLPSTKRSQIPPWKKENSSKVPVRMGYVTSLEGTFFFFHIFFSLEISDSKVSIQSLLSYYCHVWRNHALRLVFNKTYTTKPNSHPSVMVPF